MRKTKIERVFMKMKVWMANNLYKDEKIVLVQHFMMT